MAEENFEALGRYSAAEEKASSLSGQRHNVLGDLSRLIIDTLGAGSYGDTYGKFNSERAAQMVERAKELDAQMMAAVDEANRHAAAAKKPVLNKKP